MAGSVNKVILVGNLGNDPEVRSTQDGKEIANFSLATTESWKDKNTGERKDKTEWHRVVVFSPALVNIAKQYLKKGSKIFLEGSLQTRKWVDNNGTDRYTTEIALQGYNSTFTMLDNASSAGQNAGSSGYNTGSNTSNNNPTNNYNSNNQAPKKDLPKFEEEFDDDEIPF